MREDKNDPVFGELGNVKIIVVNRYF